MRHPFSTVILVALGLGRTAAAQESPPAPGPGVTTAPSASSPPASAPVQPALSPSAPSAPSAPAPAPAPAPATTPAPATVSAPPALAPAAAPPAPAASAAPPVATHVAISPGEAVVHVAVNHRDAWLEMRSYVDGGESVRVCQTPCDLKLQVEGREARVVAPGMTTSNVFRFDPGAGTAGVRVDGGSASARRTGIITLGIGIPVALGGMALFALGRVKKSSPLEVAGISALAVGGVSVSVSLPLLFMGTTSVKNAKGSLIAFSEPSVTAH